MDDPKEKAPDATSETKALPDDTPSESVAVVKLEEEDQALPQLESENVAEAQSEVKEQKSVLSAGGEWRVIGETVPGASHLRAGVPNQDALLQVRAERKPAGELEYLAGTAATMLSQDLLIIA